MLHARQSLGEGGCQLPAGKLLFTVLCGNCFSKIPSVNKTYQADYGRSKIG